VICDRQDILPARLSLSAQLDSQQPNQQQDANQRPNRLTFEISSNPATAANKIKQLSTDPFMLINPDHPLAAMLPDALNTTDYAPKVGIGIKKINFFLLGGLALTTEVVNAGLHFIIDPARLTKLFTDMDAHGASFLPIQGNATSAMPSLRGREGRKEGRLA
jgi:hypothetical protein